MSAVALNVPSMVDTFHGRTPTMLSDRPSMFSDSPSMLSESPSMVTDDNSTIENNSACLDRPSMISENYNNKRESDEDSLVSPDDLVNQSQKPVNTSKRGKRKKYQKYTPEDRFAIGKYCFEHGPAAARKAFQDRYPEMSESVTRGFRDKYKMIIGESAVYEFEQRRRRDLHKRTAPLPRGRPRKYKPIEFDDEMPASMVPRNTTPPSTATSRSTTPPLSMVRHNMTPPSLLVTRNPNPPLSIATRNHDVQSEVQENIEAQKNTIQKFKPLEYSSKHVARIGKMCAQDGVHVTMSRLKNDFPDLNEELVLKFEKKYLESDGVLAQPQVFILEGGDSVTTTFKTIATTTSITTQSDDRRKYSDEIETTCKSIEQRNCRITDQHIQKPFQDDSRVDNKPISSRDSKENGFVSLQPIHTVTHPISSVVPGTCITGGNAPIIHYPKLHNDVSLRFNDAHEHKRIKREYSSAMETNGYSSGGYPYDRHAPERRTNDGNSSSNGIVGESASARAKRFKYQKYTPEDRYNIGKLCNDIGLGATVKVYREQFPRLNESVVRTFRNKYRELLQKGNGTTTAEAIERKPSRRSISTLMENEIVSQLRQFKISEIELSANLVIAVAENLIASKDPRETVGMKAMINKEWASSLLWKHKLIEKPLINTNSVCCERCQSVLVCPKCN